MSSLMTPAELANMLRVTERTLDNWRDSGTGPPYIRLGNQRHHRVLYNLSSVLAWLDQNPGGP